MPKAKRTKKQKLKDKADEVFSLFIRLKASDWRGNCQCYTCGKVSHYKQGMQCGHFISRSSNKLRFDERNARVQCVGCNVYKKGNYIEYTSRMIEDHGKRYVDKLRSEGKDTYPLSEEELTKIIKKYERKIKLLSK